MIFVVGSGPAGVASAYALLKKGLEVTMLDSGLEIEEGIKEQLEKMGNTLPENWDNDFIGFIKKKTTDLSNPGGITIKYVYGSDFPYQNQKADNFSPEVKDVEVHSSLAKGGLSNVWGGTVMPYLQQDIADWPISISDMAPHYKEVLSFINLSATKDDLDEIFPLYTDNYHPLQPSQQMLRLMDNLLKHKKELTSDGFVFGLSRLAMYSQNNQKCALCGLCMYGCPYSLIYNAAFTLNNKLLSYKNFYYKKDIIVKKITESKDRVNILAQSRLNGEELNFQGSKVYLACGTLSTTKILLASMEAYEQPITLKTSQHFFLPLFTYKATKNIVNEGLHTLCQGFIEMFDSSLSERTIHLQVYTYNDLFLYTFKNMLKGIFGLFKYPIYNLILPRLILLQGYLHSDLSPTISLQLDADSDKFKVKVNTNPETKNVVSKIVKKIFKNRKYFKSIPISFMIKVSLPGGGAHSGGTFPMRENPSRFESDILGRPYGFQRTHIVDSAVFSSIPATTIALTIMANAHRITSSYND